MSNPVQLASCAFTTLTGIDDYCAPASVVDLANLHHGRVEWGVLMGPRVGNRYPSLSVIESWVQVRRDNPNLRLALHLCGQYASSWIANDPAVVELALQFDRIQLNVNARSKRFSAEGVREALLEGRHPAVITQHNRSNISLTENLLDCPHHALLFDSSGGRGILAGKWPPSIGGKVCGYAGGLGPGLIAEQLFKIGGMANGPYWIDMENSLRDSDDKLDLSRCVQVLDEVDAWRDGLAHALEAASPKPSPSP
jgi:hypothetical protein